MPGSKRSHQKALQRRKAEAARAARMRADQRKRRLVAAGAVVVVLGLVAALVLAFTGGDDDETDVATDGSTTSTAPTTAAPESVAGKPCVKLADPLPAGAPDVPVEEGPPPEKLIMKDLVEGTGAPVTGEAEVTVNYIGVACSTGKIFDSSYAGGQPATFSLTGVIPGWTQGIPGMKVGGRRLLGIPSALAYGPQGNTGIAPDEALWFVVEILDTKPAPE